MTWAFIIILTVSATASLFAYWRAFRLHLRILDIEPDFCGMVSRVLDRLFPRKDKR